MMGARDEQVLAEPEALHRFQAAVSLAREVVGESDPARAIELVLERGRQLIDANAMLALWGAGGRLVVAFAVGEGAEILRGRWMPAADHPDPSDVIAGLGLAPGPILLSPLPLRDQQTGFLVAFNPRGPQMAGFDTVDKIVLESLATSTAAPVAVATTIAAERRRLSIAAAERERQRWARELHDETLQELGAAKVMHDSALQNGSPSVMRSALEQATTRLESLIAGLEGLITDLRPAALDQLGVEAAIETLVDRVQATRDLTVENEVNLAYEQGREPTRLDPELEATLYRFVQEALNNVIKHADADQASVSIVECETRVIVKVRDNGRGFDPDAHQPGFGLVGMRERVRLAGGELSIESDPDGGTEVSARLLVQRHWAGR